MDLAPLIDRPWYLARYADVAAAGIDPVEHYLRQGWREARQPNWYFDPGFYGTPANPANDPLLDYATQGEVAGRRPSRHFDPAWFRSKFQVPARDNCLAFYLAHRGTGDVSPTADFDAGHYLRRYPDVAAHAADPFMHYVTTGRAEGRLPLPEAAVIDRSGAFDANHYLLNAADVLEAGGDPLVHFCTQGWREDRNPNAYFDVAWYCRSYPGRAHANALTDYVLVGEPIGRQPGPLFDPEWYRATYRLQPDTLALAHWLRHRRSQRFSPLPDFNVAAYVTANRERLRPDRDPFMHALAAQARRRAGRA